MTTDKPVPARNRPQAPARNALHDDLDVHIDRLAPAWKDTLNQPAPRAALHNLRHFLLGRLADGAEIYPHDPFRALNAVQPDSVQVLILGQDPYHGANQAQGLAFSVPDNGPCPPSLRNIFKELALEYPDHGVGQRHDLTRWAKQGVLLLNTVLTVESGRPASHAKKGWEAVTDAIIKRVAAAPQPKVFMLWGAYAQAKQALLPQTGPAMLVLTANHPSPLSAARPPKPFIGSQHFILANKWLRQHGRPGIDWLTIAPVAMQQQGDLGFTSIVK